MPQKHCPKVKENFAQRSHPEAKQEAEEVRRALKSESREGPEKPQWSRSLSDHR